MKVHVYLYVSVTDNELLIEKINEFGYKVNKRIRGDMYQIYSLEINTEDLVVLKLCIPSLEVDIRDNG